MRNFCPFFGPIRPISAIPYQIYALFSVLLQASIMQWCTKVNKGMTVHEPDDTLILFSLLIYYTPVDMKVPTQHVCFHHLISVALVVDSPHMCSSGSRPDLVCSGRRSSWADHSCLYCLVRRQPLASDDMP